MKTRITHQRKRSKSKSKSISKSKKHRKTGSRSKSKRSKSGDPETGQYINNMIDFNNAELRQHHGINSKGKLLENNHKNIQILYEQNSGFDESNNSTPSPKHHHYDE